MFGLSLLFNYTSNHIDWEKLRTDECVAIVLLNFHGDALGFNFVELELRIY